MLLVLVENHGQTLTRSEITKRVWGSGSHAEGKFHVTLHAVRQKLGDSAKNPRFIAKDANGYRFVADVEQIVMGGDPGPDVDTSTPSINNLVLEKVSGEATSEQDAHLSRRHVPSVLVSCALYAALYAVALVLEVSYEFDRFGSAALKIAPLVFCWITITSFAGLAADKKLTSQGRASGLAVSAATFLIAAVVLFAALTRFLPSWPVTQSVLQSYPAQAAYLKDMIYFLVLGFCFLTVPFHFIVTVERDIARGRHNQVLGMLNGDRLSASPSGTIYPRFWALASLLVVLAAFSLVMTSRLLDHLKPGPYTNLFTQLVYVRGFLYFGLGVWCLIWYYQAIDETKRRSQLDSS